MSHEDRAMPKKITHKTGKPIRDAFLSIPLTKGQKRAVIRAAGFEWAAKIAPLTIVEPPENTLDRRLAQAPSQFRKRT